MYLAGFPKASYKFGHKYGIFDTNLLNIKGHITKCTSVEVRTYVATYLSAVKWLKLSILHKYVATYVYT